MRNPNWPPQRTSVVVLTIFKLVNRRQATQNVQTILVVKQPRIGVQGLIAEQLEHRSMMGIGTGLSRKALHATGGPAELRGGRRSRHLELGQCFYRRRCLVKGRQHILALNADTVEKNLSTEVLSARYLGFKD